MSSLASFLADPNAALPHALPTLTVVPDRTQLFMFSAATWNRHRIHFDREAAISEGLPDVVVHRALIGNFFARLLGGWAADRARIHELSWKVTSSALPGRELHCDAVMIRRENAGREDRFVLTLQARDDRGNEVASGAATLVGEPA